MPKRNRGPRSSTRFHPIQTSNWSSKTRGAAAPRTRITWASFLDLEEPLLKLSRSAKLQRTNSSSISNCRRSKSAIFISRNINYNINSLLLLRVGTRVGTRIIYIYVQRLQSSLFFHYPTFLLLAYHTKFHNTEKPLLVQ